jgi:tetratricopeptide (TPR) repeat protein
MKKVLFFIFIVTKSFGQVYQPFIFVENKPFVYDTAAQHLGQKAIDKYYKKQYVEAVKLYDSLFKLKPSYYQGYFNQARCLALIGDNERAVITLNKYVVYSKERCSCDLIKYTKDFESLNKNESLDSALLKCCSYSIEKVKNEKLMSRLIVLDAVEQEILGNDNSERDRKLKENFKVFCSLVDTTNFPGVKDIGNKGINSVSLIILHADYYPTIQNSLGRKLMKQYKKKGYNVKQVAYIIDRSLRNMGQPQLYGTILYEDESGKRVLYKYDSLEELVKRRKELGFQSYEEFLKNKSILK